MKILVAIDCSSYAAVLEQLAIRTWPDGCQFQIISVVEESPNWEVGQELLHQSGVILERRLEYLQKRLPRCVLTGQVLEGCAGAAIVRTAGEWHADLVVIGSHGDTGRRKPAIGSVAAQVVNEANCSVEVIKLRQLQQDRPAA